MLTHTCLCARTHSDCACVSTRLTATWMESCNSFPHFQISDLDLWAEEGQALGQEGPSKCTCHNAPVLPKGTRDHLPAHLHMGEGKRPAV